MATALSVAFTPSAQLGIRVVLYATAPLSQGVQRPGRHAFKLIRAGGSTTVSPLVCLSQYNAIFGDIPPGRRIFCKVVRINQQGLSSPPFETFVDTT